MNNFIDKIIAIRFPKDDDFSLVFRIVFSVLTPIIISVLVVFMLH